MTQWSSQESVAECVVKLRLIRARPIERLTKPGNLVSLSQPEYAFNYDFAIGKFMSPFIFNPYVCGSCFL